MKTLVTFSFALASFALSAQTIPCPKGDCGRFSAFIAAAQAAAKKPDFNQAIIQYNAARVCCPAAAGKIDTAILDIFVKIDNQRKVADANEKLAQKAKIETQKALDKAKTLIGYFGFTQDRAWAYRDGKFAVIDRDAQQLTDFAYDNPDTFQTNGYALARKGSSYLLVDKNGKESQEYDYLFPTNNGWYKARKGKKHTFVDFKGDTLQNVGWCDAINTFSDGMATVTKKDKLGYINAKGNLVIEPQFSNTSDFQEGFAWAWDKHNKCGLIDKKGNFITKEEYSSGSFVMPGLSLANKPGKWGVIDKKGAFIVKAEYDAIREFENGMAQVLKKGKWGYVNEKGEEVIPPRFSVALDFSHGFAAVVLEEQDTIKGYIDTTGKFAFAHQLEETQSFSEGLAAVALKGKGKERKYGYIDTIGQFVIEPRFHGADSFSDGVAWVTPNKSDRKRWLIDKSGNTLTKVELDEYRDFSENLAAVRKGVKWGYVDRKGDLKIEPQYSEAGDLSCGMAAVRQGQKYGYINQSGKLVIEPQFANARKFEHGAAWVRKQREEGWILINKNGETLTKASQQYGFLEEWDMTSFNEGLIAVYKGNEESNYYDRKWGYVDTNGIEVIAPKFDAAFSFQMGRALVLQDSLWGYIDRTAEFVFTQPYEKPGGRRSYPYYYHYEWLSRLGRSFDDSLAAVKIGGKWGYIHCSGDTVLSPQYDEFSQFSNGRASVSIGGKRGLIDNSENFIAEIESNYMGSPVGNMIQMNDENGRVGFYNLKTRAMLKPKFSEARSFSEGVAWVRKTNNEGSSEWGLIGENCVFIIEPKFLEVKDFDRGEAWVQINDYQWRLINAKGDSLCQLEATALGDFSEGLAWAHRGDSRGYVDKIGKTVIEFKHESPFGYYDGTSYEYDERYSRYAEMNYESYRKFVSASRETGDFSNGRVAVVSDEKWGYINRADSFVIAPKYDWAGNFSDGLAWVKKDDKWGAIDTLGNLRIPMKYDWGIKFSGGLAPVVFAGKFGLMDKSGAFVANPEYDAIAGFSEGLAAVNKDDKWGYINQQGKVVIQPQFDAAGDFSNGRATVTKFDETFVINKKGQLIVDESLEPKPAPNVPDDSSTKPGDR